MQVRGRTLRWALRIFGLAAILLAIGITVQLVEDYDSLMALRREGKTTTGTIVNTMEARRSWKVTYTYDVGGTNYRKWQDISQATFRKYPMNSPVPIHYLPSNPAYGFIEDELPTVRESVLAAVGSAIFGLVCMIFAEFISPTRVY